MAEFIQVPCGLSPPGSLPDPIDIIDGGSIDPPGGCECIEGDEECCPPDPPVCEDIFIPFDLGKGFGISEEGHLDLFYPGSFTGGLSYTICDDGTFTSDNLIGFNFKNNPHSNFKEDTGNDLSPVQPIEFLGSIHPLYSIYKMNIKPRTVYGSKNSNLFKQERDFTVQYILEKRNHSYRTNGIIGYSIDANHIKTSLTDELNEVLSNLQTIDGRPYDADLFFNSIKRFLLLGKEDEIESSYLKSLPKATPELIIKRDIEIPSRSGYGINSTTKNSTREIKTATSQSTTNELNTPNIARAINIAYTKGKSLDYRKYSDKNKELLKLWYIVAEDINKRVNVVTTSGTDVTFSIPNSELIPVQTSSGSIFTVPLNNDDTYTFIDADGIRDTIPIVSDLDKARVLNNKDEEAALFNVGSIYKTKLEVSSIYNNGAEFSYDTTLELSSHYILKLNPSTISLVSSNPNIYIKVTEANYLAVSDTTEIEEVIKFKPYPWRLFPIYYDDPILGHFDFTTSYKFTFTSFNIDSLQSNYKYVRKIPKYIIIMPTDRTKYNIFNHQSVLTEWNKRKITWVHSPDPVYSNVGLLNHIFPINFSWPNEGITSSVNTQAMQASYTRNASIFNERFRSTEQPERSKSGIRQLYEMIERIDNNYIIDNNSLTWYDVLSRLDLYQFYNYGNGVSPKFISRFATGEFNNIRLLNVPLGRVIRRIVDAENETTFSTKLMGLREEPTAADVPQVIFGGKK